MNIKLMDCTLRDGGYLNNWNFPGAKSAEIINGLNKSGIDKIECGYLDPVSGRADSSRFKSINSFEENISQKYNSELYLMIEYDKFPEKLDEKNKVSGIRLAFHKNYSKELLREKIKLIVNCGYKICLQPMITLAYNKEELLSLIENIVDFDLEALYIVDSLGNIYPEDLSETFKIFDKNLNKETAIGFHAHNNLQLAYFNSIYITKLSEVRKIILDCSLAGAGRGGGNLNTELICGYLNKKYNKSYNIKNILETIENKLTKSIGKDFTGIEYTLSALEDVHPGYISFFRSKGYSISKIYEFIKSLPEEEKLRFDKTVSENILKKKSG